MDESTTSAAELLDELIGQYGRLAISYRNAVALRSDENGRPIPPSHRWGDVQRDLDAALALVSGLAAGYTTAPLSTTAGERAPCQRCGRLTGLRIYSQPWHDTCWHMEGCPVPQQDDPATTPEPAAESAAAAPTPPDGGSTPAAPAEAVNGQHSASRRRPEPNRAFELDPAEELRDFARAVRARRPDATDDQCAAALSRWHGAVTHEARPARFVSSPGYTGVAVYEWLTAKAGAMVQPEQLHDERVLELTTARSMLRVLSFIDPDCAPVTGQAVTEHDVTAQYLAAARSAELGDGEPIELGPVDPDDQPTLFKRPGYVQLGAAPNLSRLPATARLAFASVQDGWWMPTPAARYLQHDHGLVLDVADAIAWPAKQHGRRLSVWAGVFTDGRGALAAAERAGDEAAGLALIVIKMVYATFLGGMTRSEEHNDKGTLRPDWHDQYVMQAGVNALRALDKALANGATLMGGMKDSFWFLSPAADAPVRPAGMTYSDLPDTSPKSLDQPGKWHLNRHAPINEEIIAAHRAGRVGVLRKAITAADNARKAAEQ